MSHSENSFKEGQTKLQGCRARKIRTSSYATRVAWYPGPTGATYNFVVRGAYHEVVGIMGRRPTDIIIVS